MSEEYLEALKTLNYHNDLKKCWGKEFDIVEQALQRLKLIENATSSKVLQCFDRILHCNDDDYTQGYFNHDVNIVKQALLKVQEMKIENDERKCVLEIIVYKRVNVYIEIILCDTYWEYLDLDTVKVKSSRWKLTEEEFELLKWYLGKDKSE